MTGSEIRTHSSKGAGRTLHGHPKGCHNAYSHRAGTAEDQFQNLIPEVGELLSTLNSQPCQPSDVRVRTSVGKTIEMNLFGLTQKGLKSYIQKHPREALASRSSFSSP